MKYLLDTNVISETIRKMPDERKRMAKYLLHRVTPPVPGRLHPWLHRGQ